jgi:prophage regulatory protein
MPNSQRVETAESDRTTPSEFAQQITRIVQKKGVADLLGLEREREASIIACCIRDLCLRIGTVSSITGLSVPTIYREIGQNRFPRPIKITAGARAWRLSEIMEWIETRERETA